MEHTIHRVTEFSIVGDYTIRVCFADGSVQVVNLRPILAGELFGPLRNLAVFNEVRLDEEAHTLVWPNGADLDPATLHDWPEHAAAMAELARSWDTGSPGIMQVRERHLH